ncbi:hypothetical protein GCM10011289_10790 [Paludibacterium paludis]|uniref:Uncharacterized protein n=2 Tax=Paludibacterium paludis TaxID=1225769 RepID=A0A918P148_9NEIS|nr:hypothetical protein GCM10011289_10790 [Paludibacterium paludis]
MLERMEVLEPTGLDALPRLTGSGAEGDVLLRGGETAYARGVRGDGVWYVYRVRGALKDPATGKTLGIALNRIGEARVAEAGDPARLAIVAARQEIQPGDRLMRSPGTGAPVTRITDAPDGLAGRIVDVHGGSFDAARYATVAINLGSEAGLIPGHRLSVPGEDGKPRAVLVVYRVFGKVSYALVTESRLPVRRGDRIVAGEAL